VSGYRLFPSTNGGPVGADTGTYVFGLSFKVTQPGLFLTGWWWWVADSTQYTGAQDFALWTVASSSTGTYVANSKVTSGTFTVGAWNFVAAAAPIPLTSGVDYRAVMGANGHGSGKNTYSSISNYFNAGGNPGQNGIINGPLVGFSSQFGTSNQVPFNEPQMGFTSGATDVTATFGITDFGETYWGLDIQIDAVASGGNVPPLMPPGLSSPAAWQFPRYVAAAAGNATPSSGNVTAPKASLSGTGTVTFPGGNKYRLMDGFAGRPGNLSGVIQSSSVKFEAALVFEVTSDNMWFEGYWWWVNSTGMPTTAGQKFLLWQWGGDAAHVLQVPGSAATADALTAGQWNFVPLPKPIALAKKAQFIACTVYQPPVGGGFFWVQNQFGTGDPYAAGITNGPLTAFSDQSGSAPAYNGLGQGLFANSVPSLDPAADIVPGAVNSSANFGIDVQIVDQAPAGASYQMFPSVMVPAGFQGFGSTFGWYTLATQFSLSQPCKLEQIRQAELGDTTALPERCGIWNVATHALVPGTENDSPVWLKEDGTPGSPGQVTTLHVDYSHLGIVLPAGTYKVATYKSDPGGTIKWFADQTDWWTTAGAYPQSVGASGLSSGPITAPGLSGAEGNAQGPYASAAWAYPATEDLASNYWIDVRVTPVTPPVLPASQPMPPGLASPAAWQFPPRRMAATVTVAGSGGVTCPAPALSAAGVTSTRIGALSGTAAVGAPATAAAATSPALVYLTVPQGDDVTVYMQILKDDLVTPQLLDGLTAAMVIKPVPAAPDSEAIATLTTSAGLHVTGAAAGELTALLPRTLFTGARWSWWWHLSLTDVFGDRSTAMYGPLTVVPV
jgi:hypothetical protein